jgi:hypothetical protein
MKLPVYGDVPKNCPKCGCPHFTPKFETHSAPLDISVDPEWVIQNTDAKITEYLKWLCDRCKYCVGVTATRDATPPTTNDSGDSTK